MNFNIDISQDTTKNEPNFYEILGCTQLSSTEQIQAEYKQIAKNIHPDKNLDDSKAHERFGKLLEAKETLIDPKTREQYDFWLNSGGMSMSWKEWLNFTNKKQQTFHWTFTKPDLAITNTKNNENYKSLKEINQCKLEDSLKEFRKNSSINVNSEQKDYLKKFRNYKI